MSSDQPQTQPEDPTACVETIRGTPYLQMLDPEKAKEEIRVFKIATYYSLL
jgi:hypothetical protein